MRLPPFEEFRNGLPHWCFRVIVKPQVPRRLLHLTTHLPAVDIDATSNGVMEVHCA